jgi:hypothetical protein
VVARDEAITGGGGEPTGTRGGGAGGAALAAAATGGGIDGAGPQGRHLDHRPRAGGLQRLGPRRLIAQPAVGVADQDEDLGGQPAQLLRGVAGEAIGVVALGQPGEGAADLGVAGLVADAEHLERVQLAQRLELGGERRQEFVLGGGQVLALVDGGLGHHRDRAALLGRRGQRGLDQPQRALGDGVELDVDAGAAPAQATLGDVLGDHAGQHDHRLGRQRQIDPHRRAERRQLRRLQEDRVARQIAAMDVGQLLPRRAAQLDVERRLRHRSA